MKITKILSLGVIGLAVLAIGFRLCVIKIEPGSTGVLVKEWGGGLQQKDFPPGYYMALGPLHTWQVMDTTVQTLNMLRTTNSKAGQSQATFEKAIRVKSSDGADVTLDITIKYRIKNEEAWQVFQTQGAGERFKKQVATRAKDTLVSGLGTLRTEEFFDPDKRRKTQRVMEEQLLPELDSIHVDLIAILIRDLEFQESFQAKIKAKTLTKQRAEVNTARTNAAEAVGETKEIEAQTGAKVAVIDQDLEKTLTEMRAENDKKIKRVVADYEKYVVETRSKAELYANEKEAEGIRLLKDAEARGEALKRQALSGDGGATLVALRTVENLKFDHLSVSTQLVNPLDLAEMMKRLGATK